MKKEKIINILLAIFITIYFISINFIYYKISEEKIILIFKVLSMVILTSSIIIMEIAFRKSNEKLGISSIEILVLAIHTITIMHIVKLSSIKYSSYIFISAIMFIIYYIAKIIYQQTKERKEYLESLSDIKEIVKNTPTKKEATKKSKEEVIK